MLDFDHHAVLCIRRGSKRIDVVLMSTRILRAVTTACHLPFDSLTLSDHKAVCVDFDISELFGHKLDAVTSPTSRILNTKCPKKMTLYEDRLVEEFKSHKVEGKIKQVCESFGIPSQKQESVDLYENISDRITRAQKCAEKQCGRLPYGYAWSPHLQHAGQVYLHWRKVISYIKNNIPFSTKLEHEHVHLGETLPIQTHFATARKIMKAVHGKLRAIQKDATSIREDFLQARALYIAQRDDKSQAHIITQINNAEKSQQMFNRIKYQLREKPLPLSYVLVPQENGQWKRVTNANDIHNNIIDANKKVMQSARHTLPASTQFRQTFGDHGDSQAAQALVSGQGLQDDFDCPEDIKNILLCMQTSQEHDSDDPFPTELTPEEFASVFKKTRESTASSPSGIHIGHYKMAAEIPMISKCLAKMISIPFQYCFAPKRWQRSIHFMLEKVQGTPRIDKLRIIQLIEADLNAMLKVKIGRQLMKMAEANGILGEEMHGGRKGRTTTDALITQRLVYDIARQEKSDLITLNLDATKCYDRIFPNFATLTFARLGLLFTFGATIAKVLKNMKHHIKTGHGISEKEIYQLKEELWSGVGQGSAAAGPAWMSVEAFMLTYFQTMSPGASFHCPSQAYTSTTHVIGYIDDNNLLINKNNKVSSPDLVISAQKALSAWNKALTTSGGALSHDKCFSYQVRWLWKEGSAYMEDTDSPLYLEDHENRAVQIKQHSPSLEKKYLGIFLSPSGKWDDQFSHSLKAATTFGHAIAASSLRPHETYIAYQAIWRAKIRYVLTNVWFSEKQCATLQSKVLRYVIPKMKVNRGFPRAVLHGSKKFGGMGIPKHYHEQGLLSVQQILGRIRKRDHQSTLLMISLRQAQLESGTVETILDRITSIPSYLTVVWVTRVWHFLHSNDLSIHVPACQIQHPQRQHDVHIMTLLEGCSPGTKMKSINKCRMHLKVITVSDITMSDGRTIRKGILTGTEIQPSKLTWPYSPPPTESDWKIWRWALKKFVLTQDGYLCTPLGPWNHHDRHIMYSWFFSSQRSTLFFCRAGTIQRHPTTVWNHNHFQLRAEHYNGTIDGVPVDVLRKVDCIEILHRPRASPVPKIVRSNMSNLQCKINALPPSLRNILGDITFPLDEGVEIAARIRNGSLMCGSDGSKKGNVAAQAFCVNNHESVNSFSGGAKCPGRPHHMSSFRAESLGALAIITVIRAITQVHQIDEADATFHIYIDNKEVSDRMNDDTPSTLSDYLAPEYEIFEEIKYIQDQLPCNGTWHWIKAHANDTSMAGRLNDEMDSRANKIRKDESDIPVDAPFPSNSATIRHRDDIIHNHIDHVILHDLNDTAILAYMQQKYGWSKEVSKHINWEAHHHALKTKTHGALVGCVKLIHEWNANGVRNALIEGRPEECPECQAHNEDNEHIFTCEKRDKLGPWKVAIKKLKYFHTAPCIISLFKDFLWGHEVFPIKSTSTFEHLINCAIDSQKEIGEHHVRYGRIAEEWGDAQEDFVAQTSITNNFNRQAWAAQVCSVCLEYSQELWKARNEVLHQEHTGKQLQKRALQKDIFTLQQIGSAQYHDSDKKLLSLSTRDFSSLPKRSLELWKVTLCKAIEFSKAMSQKCTSTTTSIRKYFPTV